MSFTINDEVGLLVEGFDTPPKIMMPHTAPYYPKLLEGCGYAKVKELFAWDYDCGRDIPEMAQKIADRVRGMEGLTIRSVDLSKAEEEVAIIMEIFNEAWSRNWGFVPFTQKELSKLAKDLKLILDPRLALIAEYQGKPIAISIAFPDLNQMIKDLNGRLCPWRLLKLLYRVKFHKYTDARLVLLGIKREHRKGPLAGLSVLLYSEMHRRGREMGLRGGELGWTLEDNDKINKGIELMGGRVYKRYRVYEKTL
jgi:hypothetical protein